MYGLPTESSVFLYKPANVADINKANSLLSNLSIFCTLRFCNNLLYRHWAQ